MLDNPKNKCTEGFPSLGALHWLAGLPLRIDGDGWSVVHGGVNPTGGRTTVGQYLNLRRWPDENPENPFWWKLYTGTTLIIYGHDARRGLQDHRPRTLGLDTGCVYGGRLTGFVWETGEILQVQAARAYCPV